MKKANTRAAKPAAKKIATSIAAAVAKDANAKAANDRAAALAADMQKIKDSVKPKGGVISRSTQAPDPTISRLDKRAAARANKAAREDAKKAEREAIRAARFPSQAHPGATQETLKAALGKVKGAGTPQVEPIAGVTPLGIAEPVRIIKDPAGKADVAILPDAPKPRAITLPALAEDPPAAPKIVKGGATSDEQQALAKKIAEAEAALQTDAVENVEQLHDRLEKSRLGQGGGGDKVVAEAMATAEEITAAVLPLRAALLTAAKSDVRYYLQSVRLHLHGNDVRVVSTDGHKMLVQTVQIAQRPAWLDEKGVLFSAADLTAALSVCEKHGDSVTISTGVGHPTARFTSSDQFCSFRVGLVDGTFPDYERILADVDLSNEGGDPLAVAALNPVYVREATAVAKMLGATSMQTFAGNEQRAATFLFGGKGPDASNAVMVVMPMREDNATRLVTAKTVAMVGGGLASSVGALRAHLTRTNDKLSATTDRGDIAKLTERRDSLQQRINELLRLSREALPAPAAKKAA